MCQGPAPCLLGSWDPALPSLFLLSSPPSPRPRREARPAPPAASTGFSRGLVQGDAVSVLAQWPQRSIQGGGMDVRLPEGRREPRCPQRPAGLRCELPRVLVWVPRPRGDRLAPGPSVAWSTSRCLFQGTWLGEQPGVSKGGRGSPCARPSWPWLAGGSSSKPGKRPASAGPGARVRGQGLLQRHLGFLHVQRHCVLGGRWGAV